MLASGFWRAAASLLSGVARSSLASVAGGSIGALGDIAFEVSAYNNIFTIDGYKRSVKAKLAAHEVIGQKPLTEFCGPELQSVSFGIKLHASWGVNPKKEMQRLTEYCETGEVLTFVLGGVPVGDNKWIIESVGESVDYFDAGGLILYSTADVTLTEYVGNEVKADANN